jgi:hypothetical protein
MMLSTYGLFVCVAANVSFALQRSANGDNRDQIIASPGYKEWAGKPPPLSTTGLMVGACILFLLNSFQLIHCNLQPVRDVLDEHQTKTNSKLRVPTAKKGEKTDRDGHRGALTVYSQRIKSQRR